MNANAHRAASGISDVSQGEPERQTGRLRVIRRVLPSASPVQGFREFCCPDRNHPRRRVGSRAVSAGARALAVSARLRLNVRARLTQPSAGDIYDAEIQKLTVRRVRRDYM